MSEEINFDLIRALDSIERGETAAPELLPKCYKGSGLKAGSDAFRECCEDVMSLP